MLVCTAILDFPDYFNRVVCPPHSLVMIRVIYNNNYPDQKSVIRSKMFEEFECLEVDKNSLCAKRCRHHALPRDP